MMSEIDMAQRRLLDDEGPQTGQQIPSTETVPFTESELGYIDQQHQQQGMQGVDYSAMDYPEGYPQVQVPVLHPEWYNSDRNQWVENALNVGAAHTSISTFDRTQSNLSSNVYESPLQGSTNADAAMHETIQTQILNKTPVRSKSLQEPALDSPHDTVPFSSVRSPNVSRSKSDNTAQQSAQQQSQTSATDELSAPVAVEIPVIQRKAPNKTRSQPRPGDDDDDDELAAPSETKNNKQKVREARRSRNKKQADRLNASNELVETNTHSVPNKPSPSDDTPHTTNLDHDEIDIIQLDVAKTRPQPPEPSKDEPNHFTEPQNPPRREPKKKKLKRGKTTSVMLKKTYEPDVEDDVIWIDDRQHDRRPDSIPTPDSISTPAGEQETLAAVEIHMAGEDQERSNPNPEPAPKRCGRKRKKTSERPPMSAEEEPIEVNGSGSGRTLSSVSVVVEKSANSNDKQTPNTSTVNETQTSSAPILTPAPGSDSGPTSIAPETPKKANAAPDTFNEEGQSGSGTSTKTTNDSGKGPSKHSPIAGTNKVPYRVGLSRRARIAPLLKVIRK